MSDTHACAIAVMAKAPRPGKVKTRLTPPLSPDMAMAMGVAFLRDITENLALAGRETPIAPRIAYAPAGLEMLFHGLLADGTGLVLADGSGDMPDDVEGFGQCLLHATRSLFDQGHPSVCLLNADSPTLPTSWLVDAAKILEPPGDRVVLGPAEDGGYYLIGMKAVHARLFADIAWSTDGVAAQTRARVEELGLELVELPAWYDVDDRDSLGRLMRELTHPGSGYAAPAAAAAAAKIGLADMLLDRAAG